MESPRGSNESNLCPSVHLISHISFFSLLHLHGISVITTSMPKDLQKHNLSRQRPVSCRFCRSRKLRCSREAPCSNCMSRGIRCDLEYPIQSSSLTPTATEAELLERIRKLEELVDKHESLKNESVKQHPNNSEACTQRTCSSTGSSQIERLDDDVAWLESIYNCQDISVNTSVLTSSFYLITSARISYLPVKSCSGLVRSIRSRRRSHTPARTRSFLPQVLSRPDVSGCHSIPKPRYSWKNTFKTSTTYTMSSIAPLSSLSLTTFILV